MSLKKVKLGDICTIEKGAIGIQKAIPGEYPLVVTGEDRKSHNEFQFDCDAVIIPLVSGTGHGHASIKRIHFQSGKFALGNILCAVIPKDTKQLKAEYLFRFLDLNKENELVARMKGMANVTLPIKEIAQIEIPLPSIEEQAEFVEMYKQLETKSSFLSTELTHQLTLVKKLRQQLLQDAVQGKLVAQNLKDEPASELLKKIKAEKQKLIVEKKLKKEKELPPIKPEEIPFEIPENWVWCRLGDLGSFRRGPFGSALTKGIFVKEGFKVYEQRNAIYDNHMLGEYFVTKEKFEELKAFRIFPKDLIVSCSGATLGRIAEIPEDARDGIMNQALMRIKLFNSTIINSYFIRLFRSPFMQKNIFSQAWGSAIPNMVGLVEIKKILIPLPPLSEQNRIVQKLDELMKHCNELEGSIKQSESQNSTLLQQVLREALRKEPVEV
ncbi:restriction endonuclease subunit S [Polaribacter sp.]|uniref:restriction endonuclease subunit S n=2 Tax=Polaribacter sp. TaxID=1920175 RepID=UPI004047D86C